MSLVLLILLGLKIQIAFGSPPAFNQNYGQSDSCAVFLNATGHKTHLPVITKGEPFGESQFPIFELSSDGTLVRLDREENGQLLISRLFRDGRPSVSVRSNMPLNPENHTSIVAINSDAQFVVLEKIRDSFALISTLSGRVLASFPYSRKGRVDSRSFRFADDQPQLTMTEIGYITSYRLNSESASVDHRVYVGDTRPPHLRGFGFDGMSSAHRLGKSTRFVAFYRGPHPLILESMASGLKTNDFHLRLDAESYGDGLVSTQQNLLLVPGRKGTRGFIDVVHLDRLLPIRSYAVPEDNEMLALSSDGALMAAANLFNDSIWVFDLQSESLLPIGKLWSRVNDLVQIRFIDDRTIGLTSADGAVKSITLPERH